MFSAQDLQDLINAQPPIQPTGPALAFLIVTIVFLVTSTISVGLRVWYRFWKKKSSRIWGWDDILAIIGQIGFVGLCAFGIMMPFYGIGTPDSKLNPFLQLKTAHYYIVYNGLFAFTSCFIKTSIGIAILRISNSRPYSYMVIASLFAANVTLICAFIWSLTLCTPVAARWNPLLGTCKDVNALPSIYVANTFALIVDLVCVVVPILVLRQLAMPRKTKYGLMVLLATGGATVVVVVARFPFVQYLDHDKFPTNTLYNTVGYEIMCIIEIGFGQIAGCAPTLGKMFHIYDKPATNATPGQTAQRYKTGESSRTSKAMSKQLSSRQRRDSDSNISLVPYGKGETSSRISRGNYEEEANKNGIVQQMSFSILKAEKGPEGEGNFWRIESEQS